MEKAIKSGDFSGHFSEATKWLNTKAPSGEVAEIAETAQGGLFKDAALATALVHRQFIAK